MNFKLMPETPSTAITDAMEAAVDGLATGASTVDIVSECVTTLYTNLPGDGVLPREILQSAPIQRNLRQRLRNEMGE